MKSKKEVYRICGKEVSKTVWDKQLRYTMPSTPATLCDELNDILSHSYMSDENRLAVLCAVNAHEELLQMVKDLRRACDVVWNSGFNVFNTDVIDALIAKAEGK